MRDVTRDRDWFLRDPRTRRWIRRCCACGALGRDPSAPDVPKLNFEAMFPAIALDDRGMCEPCSAAAGTHG